MTPFSKSLQKSQIFKTFESEFIFHFGRATGFPSYLGSCKELPPSNVFAFLECHIPAKLMYKKTPPSTGIALFEHASLGRFEEYM